jgi:alkanesulfonate monooxygenase SsuD/methylene tetrahydromethanopterin reductase-like flavin-dependent oxidoreductase (luciferase family)
MAPIQFGWVVPSGPRDAAARDTFVADVRRVLALIADRFDSVWMTDHLQFKEQDLLECWTVLSYFAAAQPTLRFGTVVLGQSYRNPALTAKMAATLHFLSGGRLLFGIGAGWKENEYHAYGYDFPPSGVRVEQLAEALQIIKALWTDEQATFQGRYYRIEQAYCAPKPAPLPADSDRRSQAAYAAAGRALRRLVDRFVDGRRRLPGAGSRDGSRLRRGWARPGDAAQSMVRPVRLRPDRGGRANIGE